MNSLPILDLPADPWEAGFLHGKILGQEVHENLRIYQERLEKELAIPWEEGLRQGRRHLERLSVYAPDYLLAVRALASGAEISEQEAGFLDARYEIFYFAYAKEGLTSECTAFAILPERSAEGDLFLAQNWDWFPGIKGVWLRLKLPDLQVLAFTEAGIPGGKIGVNSAGLALCVNGLVSPWDRWDGEGLPFHARAWKALAASTLEEAKEIVLTGRSPCSANFLLGQKDQAVSLERAPFQTYVLHPDNGVLGHTNHFLCPAFSQPLGKEYLSSFLRQARLEELLAEKSKVREAEVFEILSDHYNFPASICRHPNELEPAEKRYATVLSCVLRPEKGEVTYIWGRPCEGQRGSALTFQQQEGV